MAHHQLMSPAAQRCSPSFLSSSLFSFPPRLLPEAVTQPTSSAPTRLVVSAQQIKVGDDDQSHAGTGSFLRRELLVTFNAAAVMATFWDPIVNNPQIAHSADLTQRIQRGKFLGSIQDKLRVLVKENQALIPSLLQLALNDAVTYDKASKTGGPNGSIYLSLELNRPENKGLAAAVEVLETLKKDIDAGSKGGPLTWADLFQIAGQSALKRTFLNAAIQKCGGKVEKGESLYQAYGSSGQWGQFDKQLGRAQATEPDPEGRVLVWGEAPVADIKARFGELGFKPRQLAVMAIFLGPDLVATESKLASDPEIAPWVDKYQRSRETVSQTDYEVDLITAYTRLSTLGQVINYEAYTFAPTFKFKL